MAAGLAATMMMGGAGSVFADGKGKDRDDDDGKIEFKGKVQIILNFDDIKGGDVEWAQRYIASLAAKRVFEGYEDGSFQPRKPISRIEAITAAVRLMGLRAKAESQEEMSTKLNFKDADKIAKQYSWAVGYVAVAVENDLFLETDEAVQPEKPADRLWATMLLVKAMKLEAEAKAKMNSKLNFKDAEKIPAGAVGYVKVAVEKGLINGYEDNTFRPDRVVTRAELAALLDRTGDQMPGQDQTLVTGKLTAAPAGNVLTVEKSGVTKTVAVDAGAFIYRNGVKVALSALKSGDELKIRTYNNVAIFIEVTKLAPEQQNTFSAIGVYQDMTLNAEGKIATIKINQNVNGTVTAVTYNAASSITTTGGTLPAPNKVVELKGANNLVTEIKIYP